jgi:proteasome lid subunit RPN8/RPN11
LSQDEIVFDEVRFREPQRARRPDRDRRFACLAYEVPGPDDLPVFLDHKAADAIERHALRDTSVELGGILLGKECVDEQTCAPFVWVTQALEARHYENTQASFTYTHDSWEEITRERERRHPELDVVGWYHTHPDFGVFLSGHDLFIQRHFFGQPLQVAYVVDPVRQTRGFFQWRGGSMAEVGGFYLTAERSDRVALARLANDLENVPSSEPSGGGLSPRLEAQLIAMLSRPATHVSHASAADRTQSAALFAMLGALLGVVGLSAVLWLNALHGNLQEQARAIDAVRKTLDESTERQRVALDAAVGEASGATPEGFLKRYATAARDRDEARDRLANQQSINESLAAKNRQLTQDLTRLEKDYKLASTFEKEAKQAAELRAQLDEAQAVAEKRRARLEELEPLLDTPEGKKALAALVGNQKTWYYAVAGWSLSLVLALALVGGYVYYRFPPDEPSDSPTGAGFVPEDPTHRIS